MIFRVEDEVLDAAADVVEAVDAVVNLTYVLNLNFAPAASLTWRFISALRGAFFCLFLPCSFHPSN